MTATHEGLMATNEGRVATVAGEPIPVSRLEDRLAELRRGPLGRHVPPDASGENERLRRWVVQELVVQAALAHEARQAGLVAEPDSTGALDLPVEVVQALFNRVTAEVVVPDHELRAYHARNGDRYHRPESRWVRYAIAPDAPTTRAALDQPSADGPGVRRGDLPALHRGELVGQLEDALFEATVGEVVGPFPFGEGWITAVVVAITPESGTPFAEARSEIEAELVGAARSRSFDDWIASRVAALALIEPAFEHPGHPLHGLPHHRH
jgi:[acyl-carrier-protein] S-malonyltransferase